MAKAKKLTREEAEEYTRSLGQVAVGNFGLMDFAINVLRVPESLSMTPEDWVQEKLGGYIRWSVEQRRAAVRELSSERLPSGRYVRSSTQVAAILGISKQTVERDRQVLELESPSRDGDSEPKQLNSPSRDGKLTPAEKKVEMRRLIDLGQSNAQIAVEMGIGVSTVGKERAAYRKEQDDSKGTSPQLQRHKDAKQADLDNIPEADRKAADAVFDDFVSEMRTAFSSAAGVYLKPLLADLTNEMNRVSANDLEIPDYEETVAEWIEVGRALWFYGAKRGYDVSRVAEMIDRLRGDDPS